MTNPEILGTADSTVESDEKIEKIIQEIIAIERRYYNEKRNVKTERQKKVKEVIERRAAE